MNDEADGRPPSTGSIELNRSHIEEIGYLTNQANIKLEGIHNGNVHNGTGIRLSHNAVYMEMVEQPQARGFRFRYPSEGSSHGGLQGELSARHKKTYPAVKIRNYNGPCRIVVSLVTDEQVPRVHAHELVGKNCKNGICVIEMKGTNDMVATFPNLGIQHVTKKKVVQLLTDRILEWSNINRAVQTSNFSVTQRLITDADVVKAKKQAPEQAKSMQLNVVRLMFQAYLQDTNGSFTRTINPVLSRAIYDSKSPGAAALKICRMDKHAGCCSGREEVFLLCDKVQKDDIHVRFFEEDNEGAIKWEGFGDFGPADVHRQYAIVFKTPPYWDTNIQKPVNVQVQLKRMSDGETSEAKPFTYYPMLLDKEEVGKKRRKLLPPFAGGGGGGYYGGGRNYPGIGPPGSGGNSALGGGMFDGSQGFQGGFGGGGMNSYQAMLGLGDSSEESSSSSSDEDTEAGASGRRRGTKALHTFAYAEPAAGPRTQRGGKRMPQPIAVDSSSESGSETDSEEDEPDGGFIGMTSASLAAEEPQMRNISNISVDAVRSHVLPHFADENKLASNLEKLQLSSDEKKKQKNPDRKEKKTSAKNSAKESQTMKAPSNLSSLDLAYHVAERTNTGLQNYAATGDVRHMLLIQRHLVAVQDANGDTALHVAIINRQIQVVQNLLNIMTTIPNCEAINQANFLQQTPLHLAVLTNQPRVVELLVNLKAQIPVLDRYGNTPIHIASEKGDSQCLGNILKKLSGNKPAPCPLNFNGYTPLILAVLGGHLRCVKMLVSAGAEVGQPDGRSGRTPLHHAVEADNVAIAGYLLLEGQANPNIPTFDGNTALHLAVGRNQLGMAALLITADADPHAENLELVNEINDENQELPPVQEYEHQCRGTTPMDLAQGNEKMVKILEGESYSSISTPPATVILPPSFRDTVSSDSYKSTFSSSTTSSISSYSSISPSQFISQRGDLHKLDSVSRTSLAKLLDGKSDKNWSSLAEKLAMSNLIAPLKMHPSPTKALLDNFEAIEGSIQQLLDALISMERQDAVSVIRDALKYHIQHSKSPVDKLDDDRCNTTESGFGSMGASLHENSLSLTQ